MEDKDILETRDKPENDHMAIMQIGGVIAKLTPFQYKQLRIWLLAQPTLKDWQEMMKS